MNLICTSCPVGCRMTIIEDKKGDIKITGNACKRGEIYAYDEFTDPKRMVTTSVKVIGGIYPLVSIKTNKPIKKDEVKNLLAKLKKVKVTAPIKIGDVIQVNFEDSHVQVVATRKVNCI